MYKVPYTIVVGNKEAESREVSPRIAEFWKATDKEGSYSIDGFLKTISNEAKSRVSRSSL